MKSGRDKDGAVFAAPVVGSMYPKRFGLDQYVFRAGPVMGSLASLDRVFHQQVGVIEGLVYVESLGVEVSVEGDPTTAVGATVEATRAIRVSLETYVVAGVRGVVVAEQDRSDDIRLVAVDFPEVGVVSVTLRRAEPSPVRRLWGMRKNDAAHVSGASSSDEVAGEVAAHCATVEAELW